MTSYARVQDGVVVELIQSVTDDEGQEIPVEARFHPDFVATLVALGAKDKPNEGWTYDGKKFSAPMPPAPSIPDMMATRDGLLQMATLRIAPLQDATDLGEATAAETTALRDWKVYRVALNRLDFAVVPLVWPIAPDA